MATTNTSGGGRVTWFEVLGKDIQSAKSFYEKALNWKIRPFSEEFDGYLIAQTGAHGAGMDEFRGIDGGFGTFESFGFSKPKTVNTTEVRSIEETIAKAEKAGGRKVWGPSSTPDVGTTAYLEDSTGVVFGIIQRPDNHGKQTPAAETAADGKGGDDQTDGELGRVVHFEIISEDPKKCTEFYREVLGWKIDEPFTMPSGVQYWVCHTGPAEQPKPPNWSPFVNGGISGTTIESGYKFEPGTINICKVANAAETEDNVIKAGGKKLTAFEMAGLGTLAYFEDPQGIIFGIQQPEKSGPAAEKCDGEDSSEAPVGVKRRKTAED